MPGGLLRLLAQPLSWMISFYFPSGKNAPIVQLVNANTITSLMEKYRTEQEEKYRKVQRKMFPLGCTVGGCVLATAGF